MAARSYLYVPADQPDKLAKASARGADALILDLEDSVASTAKSGARSAVESWLAASRPGIEIWVRVNNVESMIGDDIAAAVRSNVTGIWLPKASPVSVESAGRLLETTERQRSIERPLTVVPLIESASSLLCLSDMAHQPRVSQLAVGLGDLGADLGIEVGSDDPLWEPILMQLVVASAAAALRPPTAPTSTSIRDLGGLRESSMRLRRLGFRSRTAVHPAQIPIIHEVFTPTAEELERARQLVERFESSTAHGTGVVEIDGRVVDRAVIRTARATLALMRGSRRSVGRESE